MPECLPGKSPLRDCEGCHGCGHCLLQTQAKFPYMDAIAGAPAWWWAGYNSAEEAQAAGWLAEVDKPEYLRQPPQIRKAVLQTARKAEGSARQQASKGGAQPIQRPPRMARPHP